MPPQTAQFYSEGSGGPKVRVVEASPEVPLGPLADQLWKTHVLHEFLALFFHPIGKERGKGFPREESMRHAIQWLGEFLYLWPSRMASGFPIALPLPPPMIVVDSSGLSEPERLVFIDHGFTFLIDEGSKEKVEGLLEDQLRSAVKAGAFQKPEPVSWGKREAVDSSEQETLPDDAYNQVIGALRKMGEGLERED